MKLLGSTATTFGSGAMFSLVSGMGGPNQATNVITSGLFFALVQGGLFQLGQKLSKPPTEDTYYTRTRGMSSSLGIQNYEKNFKKELLTDDTLPLLKDSALRDVKIPLGPRLLILDRIQRCRLHSMHYFSFPPKLYFFHLTTIFLIYGFGDDPKLRQKQ